MSAKDNQKAKVTDILATISDVGSLRKACAEHGVPKSTFLGWVAEDPDLADQYARAREAGLDAMAEEIIDISDDSGLDAIVDQVTKKVTVDGEAIARARLRTDNRRWLLSKCLPKKYGDKLDLTSGGDKLPPTSITITRHIIGEGG